jgi:DNA-binding CsgD family transcriptional regulator
MKRIGKVLIQRLREIAYLLLTFPTSIFFFVMVMIGLGSNSFLPLGIALFLLLLSAMEYIARFEIRRTNSILGTDFRVVDDWFGSPLLSWEGVKERVTSLRVWMAVAYVFVAFGWSIFSFVLVIVGLSGIFVALLSLGIAALSNFSRSFEVIDNGDIFQGSITFNNSNGRLQLILGDAQDRGVINWDLYSNWVLVVSILLLALMLWIIPRNARAMAAMTEGLLSGTFLPAIQSKLVNLGKGKKVSERDIREAMDKESLHPELADLSAREREILALMAQGKSNAGIAKTLYITEGSVEKHVSNILSKLGLKSGDDNHRRVLAVLTYLGIDPSDK